MTLRNVIRYATYVMYLRTILSIFITIDLILSANCLIFVNSSFGLFCLSFARSLTFIFGHLLRVDFFLKTNSFVWICLVSIISLLYLQKISLYLQIESITTTEEKQVIYYLTPAYSILAELIALGYAHLNQDISFSGSIHLPEDDESFIVNVNSGNLEAPEHRVQFSDLTTSSLCEFDYSALNNGSDQSLDLRITTAQVFTLAIRNYLEMLLVDYLLQLTNSSKNRFCESMKALRIELDEFNIQESLPATAISSTLRDTPCTIRNAEYISLLGIFFILIEQKVNGTQ